MDIFTNTFDAREYSPKNQESINLIKTVDAEFMAGNKLSDININAKYVYRCEYPYNHYVSFFQPILISKLPPTLHEHYDRTKPIRLAFDIERAYNAELIEKAVKIYKERGGQPARLRDILEQHFIELVGVYTIYIDRIIRARYLGKFMQALDGSKKKKVQEADLVPTVLESFRYVPDNYLSAVKQKGYSALPAKFSCHIIYKDVWLIDSREAGQICEAVFEEMSKELKGLASRIDRAIYSHVNFRAYGCSKKEEPERILRQLGEIDVYIRDEFNLQRGQQPTHVMPYKKRKEAKPEEEQQQRDDEFAELIEYNAELLRGYRLERQSGKYIRLRGEDAAICPICERSHGSGAQNYIQRAKYGYVFRCGHPDSKGKAGIIMRRPVHAVEYEQHAPALLRGMDIHPAEETENTVILNKKYIEDELAVEYARGSNLLFVSSPMGTGKTFALRKFLEVCGTQSVCMLSFRKAFTVEKAKDLGLESYLDLDKKIDGAKTPRVIIQVEALARLMPDFKPNILIIDEMESIMEQINKVRGDMHAAAMDTFKRVVASARTIVVMDANLTTASIKYFTRVRQDLAFRIIMNTYRHTDIAAKVYGHTSEVVDEFVNFVEKRGPAAMCSDSKAVLDDTRDRLIRKGIPADQIFVASSETAEERKRLVDEHGNITVMVGNYRAFLYNTTILAGVSIEDPTKRHLFAVFMSNFITPLAACQLIGRVRCVETLHIAANNIEIVPRKKSTHIGILMRTTCDNLFANAKELPAYVPSLLRLYAKNMAAREFGQATLLQCVVVLLARHGYAIEFMPIGRHRKLIGSLVKARDAELDRIIAAPDTEFARAKFNQITYDGHVPQYLHKYLTKADIKMALRPDVGLMIGNLRYIDAANAVVDAKPGVMAIGVKYDITNDMARETDNVDSALEAATGSSSAAYLTGLAVSFLRGLRCDMSGIIPRCEGIARAAWLEYLDRFAQDNAIGGKDSTQCMKKINKILMAAFGIKFSGSKQRETTPQGRQPVSYSLEINKDIEHVDGRWQLKCVARAQIEAEKAQAAQIMADVAANK